MQYLKTNRFPYTPFMQHGMKFDPTSDGPVQGFQLWINLKSANKLDPPEFQNARADAVVGRLLPRAAGHAGHRRADEGDAGRHGLAGELRSKCRGAARERRADGDVFG